MTRLTHLINVGQLSSECETLTQKRQPSRSRSQPSTHITPTGYFYSSDKSTLKTMNTIPVKIYKTGENVRLPRKGSDYAAGFDLFSNEIENIIIKPGERKFIRTGLIMEIPTGFAGFIYARSGLGCKFGVVPSNCVGVIDSDYRGEIMVCLHNHGTEEFEIRYQYCIAQIVIMHVPEIQFIETKTVNELTSTIRNDGGFGSTGK